MNKENDLLMGKDDANTKLVIHLFKDLLALSESDAQRVVKVVLDNLPSIDSVVQSIKKLRKPKLSDESINKVKVLINFIGFDSEIFSKLFKYFSKCTQDGTPVDSIFGDFDSSSLSDLGKFVCGVAFNIFQFLQFNKFEATLLSFVLIYPILRVSGIGSAHIMVEILHNLSVAYQVPVDVILKICENLFSSIYYFIDNDIRDIRKENVH